jgi:hypothetical protein
LARDRSQEAQVQVREESIERLDRVDLFERDQDPRGEVVQPVKKVL